MAQIGNLGKTIVFSTSDKKILNFNNFKQTISGRWGTHERIQKKSLSEFLGADLRQITFNITLNVSFGVKPSSMLVNIHRMVEKGTVETLVIGGKKIGGYKWKMTSASETWDTVMSKGELVKASVSITLEEYL